MTDSEPWSEHDWDNWHDLLAGLAKATGFTLELVTYAVGTDNDCSDAIETHLLTYEVDEFELYRLCIPLNEFKERLKPIDARQRLERKT